MSLIKEDKFIKCPACGSTTEVELAWSGHSDSSYSRIERDYICKCSCEFTVFFEAKEFRINPL